MSCPRAPLVVTMLTAVALAAAARLTARQVRDAAGSGGAPATLTGIVTADDSGRPVERALVTVHGVASPFARVASTDAQGRFTFGSLPAGDITVSATKTTYLTAYYGARDVIRGPAVPIMLAGGGSSNIALHLVRGAVIAGTVKGPTDRPEAGVRVLALPARLVRGPRPLAATPQGKGGVTDDLGRYRIWGLAPGDYFVEARPDSETLPMRLASGSQTGRIVRFAPVYYPNVIDSAQAAPVAIGAGQEQSGIDLALRTIPTADLRGTVFGPDGRPAAHVAVTLRGGLEGSDALTDDSGRFAFRGVAPGSLTISAGEASSAHGATANAWASIDVTVTGEDVSDLTLTLRPGMSVAGHVSFEGSGTPPDPSLATIVLAPAEIRPGPARMRQTTAAGDGTFGAANMPPGRYRVRPAYVGNEASSTPWLAKSVMWHGQDLLDGTLDIASGEDIAGLDVVFANRQTELGGTFFDSAGRPVGGYDVVVFAADRRFWTPESRRIQQVLLGRDGHFDFNRLPAGDYLLAAVTHADADDLDDPDWLDSVAPLALHVTLADGEHRIQDIRLGK